MEYNPKELVPGDILLFKRNKKGLGIISNLIRLIQGNQYVHVAIVLVPTPDPMVAEIDSGIPSRIVGYSEVTKRGIPDVYYYPGPEPFDIKEAFEFAMRNGLQPYSYKKIINSAINHLLGRLYPLFGKEYQYVYRFKSDKDICSTLVSKILKAGYGLEFNPLIEPDDFCREPFKRRF